MHVSHFVVLCHICLSCVSFRQRTDGESMRLRYENDSLKCQLEAYKNEVSLLKQEHTDEKAADGQKDKQIKFFQQTLQGMQQVRSRDQ